MSELRLETLTMPTAAVGPVNPLPPLFAERDLHAVVDAGEADAEMRHNVGYGRVGSVLPYLLQDGYGRERGTAEHKVAVLENEVLEATFLLGLGGRLWSLVHKPTGRELLYRNPVLQPANLALRNAWFAGGVEWNIGTIGHSPTTCEPLHAARVLQPDGTPVLRMYEFERMREVVFQVDAWLPEDSPVLLVHVRIVNPSDTETPMYWWSNIAVPQADDVRVLAPADTAWQFSYDRALRRVPIARARRTRPHVHHPRASEAADYFFAIDDDQRRWVTALDGRGTGLVQTSTDRLRGRKLFLWGKSAGGDHWQEWLAQPGAEYLEIQAGLARTQLEHLPMPGRASWSWVEAYGLLETDADAVHGDDWARARASVSATWSGWSPVQARAGARGHRDVGRLRTGGGAGHRLWVGRAGTPAARAGRRRVAAPAGDTVLRRVARSGAGCLARAGPDRADAVATGGAGTGVVPDQPPLAAAARRRRRLAAQAAPRRRPRGRWRPGRCGGCLGAVPRRRTDGLGMAQPRRVGPRRRRPPAGDHPVPGCSRDAPGLRSTDLGAGRHLLLAGDGAGALATIETARPTCAASLGFAWPRCALPC